MVEGAATALSVGQCAWDAHVHSGSTKLPYPCGAVGAGGSLPETCSGVLTCFSRHAAVAAGPGEFATPRECALANNTYVPALGGAVMAETMHFDIHA